MIYVMKEIRLITVIQLKKSVINMRVNALRINVGNKKERHKEIGKMMGKVDLFCLLT